MRKRIRVRSYTRRLPRGGRASVGTHSRVKAVGGSKAPPASFVSPGGRKFTTKKMEKDHPVGEVWAVFYAGKRVGSIWITRSYGPDPEWMGDVKELSWSGPTFPPTGLGFDSGPEASLSSLIEKWSRTADDLLDYYAGKPVRSMYAGGKSHRGKPGVYQLEKV